MSEVYIQSYNIISPLGFTTEENYTNLSLGKSGVKKCSTTLPLEHDLYISKIDDSKLNSAFQKRNTEKQYTKLEKLTLLSILDTINNEVDLLKSEKTLVIISTTKGNIELIDNNINTTLPKENIHLWSLSNTIQSFFETKNKPLLISNACISGVNAIITAQRLIHSNTYTSIVVVGVDIISDFITSGFYSFKAISSQPCKPFDKNRSGINLGEACGSILLSNTNNHKKTSLQIIGGAISNDANHISGPSRTGDGLSIAINKAIEESNYTSKDISIVNAHGTATLYNDEMESKALHLSNLENTPVNSLKAYYGHTLGASGIIETIISIESLIRNELLPTLGFEELGTPLPIKISNKLQRLDCSILLKTASGFGGGNAAVVIKKTTTH